MNNTNNFNKTNNQKPGILRAKFISIILTAILATTLPIVGKKSLKTSQTYFLARPLYHNMPARQTLWTPIINDDCNACENGVKTHVCGTIQAVALYQKSLCDSNKDVAGYFLFKCKNCLTVKGDNAISNITQRDIRAEWIGLPADFSGDFCINPKQKQEGFMLEYSQKLRRFSSHKLFKNLYINVIMPFVWVKNQTNLTGNTQIIQAFNQESWQFAKISDHEQSSHGLAEIRASIGATLYNQDDFLVATETFGIIPLKKYKYPHYLFMPIVGTNNKLGFGTNLRFDLPLQEYYADYKAILYFCIEGQYYLKDTQRRTLDLRHNPWSRYLLYQNQYSGEIVQGVNILTPWVIVNPYCFVELDAGVRFEFGGLNFELGYNFWSNGREKLELNENCCQKTEFVFQNYGISGSAPLTSASNSTINNLAPNDSSFVTLMASDLDLTSGGSRGAQVNKFYGFLGYRTATHRLLTLFAGLGGSIEVPDSNTAFKQAAGWFKLGLEF